MVDEARDVGANPFAEPSFRRWFRAETCLVAGDVGNTAVAMVLLAVCGSVATTGRVAAVVALAGAVASLVGGHFGDLVARRRLLVASVLVAVTANLVVVLGVIGKAQEWARPVLLTLVTAGVVLSEAAVQFGGPVLDASLKNISTPAQYPRASSAAHARASVLSVMGEPVAGFLYSIGGWLPFVLRASGGAGFLAILAKIPNDLGPRIGTLETSQPGRRGYGETLEFLSRERDVLALILATPLVNVLVFSGMRWTVYVLGAQGASALTVGVVATGFAAGALVGSALAPRVTDTFSSQTIVVGGLCVMTTLFGLLFTTGHRPVLMFGVAVMAMLPSPALNACLAGHIFTRVPETMQARVIALFIGISAFGAALASWGAGLAVASGRTPVLAIGVVCAGVCGVLLVAGPATRRMGKD